MSEDQKNKNKSALLYKTEMCRAWVDTGKCCYFNKCLFAHGENDLRSIPNIKTKPCLFIENMGFCMYGDTCRFIHDEKKIKNKKNAEVLKDRLRIFQNICPIIV